MSFELANDHVLIGLAVAFGVGLLIGVEREQRRARTPRTSSPACALSR